MPYRTNPIGDPVTKRSFLLVKIFGFIKEYFVRSQSVAATPDREVKRKWSISASTDYLNKTNKDNYMVRNNPIGNTKYSADISKIFLIPSQRSTFFGYLGLAEPSVKRDGYAVGSKEVSPTW